MPTTIKKLLHWFLWGFLIYAIITNPDAAAAIVLNTWEIISQSVLNIGRFFNNLLGR